MEQIPIRSIFSAGDKATRKVILLEGVAGSGKSTLCWYVSREWAEGRMFPDLKLIILHSLGDETIHTAKSLADLIPHPAQKMRESVAEAVASIQGEGICFLFDACDEAPQLFARGTFLSQFIAGTKRNSMSRKVTILLVSRPGQVIPYNILNCITGKVVIKGFKSLDHFIEMAVNTDSLKRGQIFEALEMKPKLYSLCHLPLHAVILVHLFEFFKESLPTTRTDLFHPLVCNFLIRHMQTRTQHGTMRITNLSTDLPSDVLSSLCKVSCLAYQSCLNRRVTILPHILRDMGIEPTQVLNDTFGLLQVQHQLTMHGPTCTYAFPHLSLQEFLAAFHITRLEGSSQFKAFEDVFKQIHLVPSCRFMLVSPD